MENKDVKEEVKEEELSEREKALIEREKKLEERQKHLEEVEADMKARGVKEHFYEKINIPLPVLDTFIAICFIAIIVCLILGAK